ncbi:MAG: ATP-binding protein [Verrucomicrobia bacterium]|nr:ATP-binding protein [Verrucomicrobiota bacterium]
MKRQIMTRLCAWKDNPKKKPLLLMGARQVGKTFILKEFGKQQYKNVAYLNFENTPGLRPLFDDRLDPKVLLKGLSVELEMEINAGETLIIFDEVQECPRALNSLKYFCEDAPEQHIIAAGSLLGVKMLHVEGFPVGKVEFLTLYPLSFFEFLEALNLIHLIDFIAEIKSIEQLPSIIHEKLINLLKEYLFIGGMPEAMAEYIDSQDITKIRVIQKNIINTYNLDIAKHAPKEHIMKINQLWGSIPNQLAKENKKFIYSAIREGARAREFETALQWLIEAGLIYKIPQISVPKLPLSAYASLSAFKIYLVDVGLLGAMSNLSAKTLLYGNELFQEFKGSFAENYVAQELKHSEFEPYYWASEGRAELDFVIEHDDQIYPLEVKSGDSSKKQSLRVYDEKFNPSLLIRTSPMNLKKDGKILNCPLYFLEKLRSLL